MCPSVWWSREQIAASWTWHQSLRQIYRDRFRRQIGKSLIVFIIIIIIIIIIIVIIIIIIIIIIIL